MAVEDGQVTGRPDSYDEDVEHELLVVAVAKAACTIADTTHIQDEVAPDYGDAYYEYEDWD